MNKYTIVCGICGETFHTDDLRRKFCSRECRDEAKHRTAQDWNKAIYPINHKDLKIYEVVNILVTEGITFEDYIENRDYFVLKYLSTEEAYYEH